MRKLTSTTWGILILIVSLLALITFGICAFISGKSLEGVSIIVGVLISTVTDLKGFFWGSSAGSKDKDAALSAIKNSTNTPAADQAISSPQTGI